MQMARHHKYGSRRRKNPLGISSGDVSEVLVMGAGAIGVSFVNGKLLPTMTTGLPSYAIKIGLGIAAKMFAGKYGDALMKGALVAAVLQAARENFGAQLGLSAYWGSRFPLPTVSNAYGIVPVQQALPAVVSAAGSTGGMHGATRAYGRVGRAS
jgi:hypothetical protein